MTIEAAMIFALGFLVAALLALGLLGAVWRRAVRLTTRRVENAVPLSMAEIKADKDQLRAEFAIAARRLEMTAETLRERLNGQTADLARKTEMIRDLDATLTARGETIAALEADKASLSAALEAARAADADKAQALTGSAGLLAEKEAELAALDRELAEKVAEGDSQRVEIVALRTQTANLRGQVAQLEKRVAEAEADLSGHRRSFAETSNLLTDERRRAGGLGDAIKAVEARLKAEAAEREKREAEIETLKAQVASEQDRARREQEARDEAEKARARAEAEREALKTKMAAQAMRSTETAKGLRETAETLRAEKGLLEGSLAQAREDRERIQRELAALKRDIEAAKARDGRETAMLRDRVSEVAAEVARVARLLEGPNSKIEQMLAAYAATRPAGAKAGKAGELSLADRILAVQAEAGARAGEAAQTAK